MISTKGIRIWTKRGWLWAEDLLVGDKVISFNPERNVCEYDEISSVQVEYRTCMGLGVKSNSMRQVLTEDHPLLMWSNNLRKLKRVPIRDKFMGTAKDINPLICHRIFEPYLVSQELEDIKWSARIAATRSRYTASWLNPGFIDDLGGYEAQLWLDTFFHWNILIRGVNWMSSVQVDNTTVRNMVFDIAPRAGVGAKYYRYGRKTLISISKTGDVTLKSTKGWMQQPIDGLVFNVQTKNGSVLARSLKGTHLVACEGG